MEVQRIRGRDARHDPDLLNAEEDEGRPEDIQQLNTTRWESCALSPRSVVLLGATLVLVLRRFFFELINEDLELRIRDGAEDPLRPGLQELHWHRLS
jgi:hypothetical protein